MSVVWTLDIGGTTETLEDWGIDQCTLERAILATEYLRFSCPVASIYDAPLATYGTVIKLYRDAGGGPVCWFIGKLVTANASAEGEERQHYVVANLWQDFEETIYQQQYVLYNAEATAKLGSWSSRVVLGQNQFGTKISANLQISLICNYANAIAGGSLFTFASLPSWAQPPMETVRDISCAEAIRRMTAYAPDAVGWFDYSSGATVLRIEERTALSTVTLDMSGNEQVVAVRNMRSLDHLKPRGVVLIYLTADQVEDSSALIRETRDTAGATTGQRVIFATVELKEGEPVPTGLAAQYYASLSTLQHAGDVELLEEDCSGAVRPGLRLNITNARTAWATMAATVQRTEEDIISGQTSIEVGFAEYLGLSDFADMMRRWRERPGAGSFPDKQHNGTEGADSAGNDPSGGDLDDDPDAGGTEGGDPDNDPEPNEDAGMPAIFMTMDLVYCRQEDGQARIARVVGTDAGPVP